MKSQILATAVFLTTVNLATTVQAANFEHIRQLLATKKCQNCDLRVAGLVMADLSGADLSGANLTGANLSRANLSGADLRGANLSGASLFGVNLSEAKLSGANLVGADLRNTYLINAELTGVNLSSTYLQGAIGIPLQIAKPEEFYAWGVAEAEKGNLKPAIDYFSQAIAIKPDYAGAYLSRGVARYQSLDRKSALQDAQMAEKLFTSQQNAPGMQTAQAFIKELQTPYDGSKVSTGKPSFFDFVNGVGSALLQFLQF
ncbi:putative low-complexity protein [Cylindrospermum stagnale PCC 7417]|uniref:Putative low-complexity protein n=1 Tax=Cylindrospermum stagnale PCC 7417 TaxID=56107 RepID=K9WW27_9NOST|nr:pentapeptide repeat-containing protein [Cylindrospermum stagnale]AFZ24001.1 putative low-complexity protein [Cylindrospermum stagnale PCC 7417]